MSLKKKLYMLMVGLVLIPTIVLTIGAHRTAIWEQEKVLDRILATGLKVVRGEMLERKNGMRRVCNVLAYSTSFQGAVKSKNREYLAKAVTGLKCYFDYIDYVIVVNKDNEALTKLSQDMQYTSGSKLGRLASKAMEKKEVIFSEELVPLEQLFGENSLGYDKYLVKKVEPSEAKVADKAVGKAEKKGQVAEPSRKEGVVKNALTSVAIVPVYEEKDGYKEVLGAIIVCDIFNNDLSFPNNVGSYSNDAIVLASTGGIRIAANFPEEGGNKVLGTQVGSKSRVSKCPLSEKRYMSCLDVYGKKYVVLNQELVDDEKKPIGLLGVGLPLDNYYTLATASNYFILGALILSLLVLLAGRYYLERDIFAPVDKLLQRTRAYWKNHYEADEVALSLDEAEDLVLLEKSMTFFTEKLYAREKEAIDYRNKFEEEYQRKILLTKEIQTLEANMEDEITERTEHLGTVIEELKQANAVKSRFLARLSHELKTPLHIILSSTEVLKDEILGKVNPKQKQYLEGISGSGSYLLSLINNLLDMSKIEFGKSSLSLGSVAIGPIVEAVVSSMEGLCKQKHLELTSNITPKHLAISADVQKLRQIIYNLLSNAVKFTPDNGKIWIEVMEKGKAVEIKVQDTGIGISREDLARVFTAFEQGTTPSARYEYGGAGLGLTIVKHLAEAHGGRVWIESEEGKGCTVTVSLPQGEHGS